MPLQNAPGEEIDEWVEGLPHEQLRVREDARWLALLRSGCTTLAAAEEDDDMEGQDETRFFKCGSDRFPCRIVEAWGHASHLQVGLTEPALLRQPVYFIAGPGRTH
jgi:hypothetical protein